MIQEVVTMLFFIVLMGVRCVLRKVAYQQRCHADQSYFVYLLAHTYNQPAIVCACA